MTTGFLVGGVILVGVVASGCTDDPSASGVVWTDNGTQYSSVASNAILRNYPTVAVFQVSAQTTWDAPGGLQIIAGSSRPFGAGYYWCGDKANGTRAATIFYTLPTEPTVELQDCVVIVRLPSDSDSNKLLPTYSGTFSGTAVFTNSRHFIEGGFSVPTFPTIGF